MSAPDFVAIGHVTLDVFGDVTRPGGAAAYAAVTAQRLGLSAGILTSHGDDFPLDLLPPQIEVVTIPAARTTRFVHEGEAATRGLKITAAAAPLVSEHVPEDWRDAAIVLLAPVLAEVDPLLAAVFTGGPASAAAQGWLRGVGADGTVHPRPWDGADLVLRHLQGLFLSTEDVRGHEGPVVEWFQRVPVGALTAGEAGAFLFVNGERYEVRPRASREVDPTGAGDVFAATFLIHYQRDGDPWAAAEAAACAAGLSVEGHGWSTVPDAKGLAAALADYRAL